MTSRTVGTKTAAGVGGGVSVWDAVGLAPAPTAVVDLDAFDANGTQMLHRAAGKPIRVASKSIRVRSLVERALARPGFRGVLAYSAAEALWLVRNGVRDILVAYPSVDRATLSEIAADPALAHEICLMADLPEHLQLLSSCASATPLRVCLDIDSSWQLGPAHLGAHRSSLHTPAQAAGVARIARQLNGIRVVGLMFYEAQVAGVPDSNPVIRAIKRGSLAELATRRRQVADAVQEYADLELVNGGGTGSLHQTTLDETVTELSAGSGFFAPQLFDGYDDARLHPAAWFCSPVVRKPRPDVAVTANGGYIASGPPSHSRVPVPVHPSGLRYFGQEGAGEVQTPLRGKAARSLRVGDLVWFRHGKAGEMCEHFNEVLLVADGRVASRAATYRGEGKSFG